MRPTIAEKDLLDVREWGNPDMHSMHTMIHRAAEMRVMLEKMDRFEPFFASAKHILELRGGFFWASCMVKRRDPNAVVTASDITSDAFASTPFGSECLAFGWTRKSGARAMKRGFRTTARIWFSFFRGPPFRSTSFHAQGIGAHTETEWRCSLSS
jgi:hypothetical protein